MDIVADWKVITSLKSWMKARRAVRRI